MKYMLVGCTLWRISLLGRWVIFLHLMGPCLSNFPSGSISDTFPFICSFVNASAPFTLNEYNVVWKKENYSPWNFTEYADFQVCSAISIF